MYLSRLVLNSRCRDVRRDIRSVYELHRTMMSGFPDKESGGPGRVLFRLELPRDEVNPVILVQSEKSPDWAVLERKDYVLQADFRGFSPVLETGQALSFRLRANPVKRDIQSGKRLGLIKEEDQIEWLRRKGKNNGFEVVQVTPIPEGLKQGKKAEKKLSLLAVRFEGVLQVADKDAFLQALHSGIGPGKGFGFGLLSIARAS